MSNVKGNADGKFTATTSDPELPDFAAKEMFYSVAMGRSLQGWAPLPQWPDERRNIALNFRNEGDMDSQTFDFADADPQASARWWKSTSGSSQAPFVAHSGTVTVTINATTDEARATFNFVAVSQNGKEQVTVNGELDLIPNDQGSAKP
ncbi:hypothetical protein [Pseudomonas sp. UV AK001]|uniref:hypothetical protein n=1 Tax=Pseudomonas sp. UV AK001 TaxID=3384791 RepID=UPI0038D3A216